MKINCKTSCRKIKVNIVKWLKIRMLIKRLFKIYKNNLDRKANNWMIRSRIRISRYKNYRMKSNNSMKISKTRKNRFRIFQML